MRRLEAREAAAIASPQLRELQCSSAPVPTMMRAQATSAVPRPMPSVWAVVDGWGDGISAGLSFWLWTMGKQEDECDELAANHQDPIGLVAQSSAASRNSGKSTAT